MLLIQTSLFRKSRRKTMPFSAGGEFAVLSNWILLNYTPGGELSAAATRSQREESAMDTERLCAELIHCACQLFESGLIQETNGNLSARAASSQGDFLVTPSGMPYADLQPRDICHLSADLKTIAGPRRPSVESRLHRDIYAVREDVLAIIHTHSLYACVLATARQPLPPIEAALAELGGTVQVADYADTATTRLSQNAIQALGYRQAVLLANHGLVVVGNNLSSALETCQVVERAAHKYILARSLGKVFEVPASSLDHIRTCQSRIYGQSPDEA